MRKTLYSLLTLWIVSAALHADLSWETWFHRFRGSAEQRHALQYQVQPETDWRFSHRLTGSDAADDWFGREKRQLLGSWQLTRIFSPGITSSLLFGYDLHRESGDTPTGDYKYSNLLRSSGLEISVLPSDRLQITTRASLSFLDDETTTGQNADNLNDTGFDAAGSMRYHLSRDAHSFELNLDTGFSDIDLYRGRHLQTSGEWRMTLPSQTISASVNFRRATDDLWAGHEKSDRQNTRVIDGRLQLDQSINQTILLEMTGSYRFDESVYQIRTSRDHRSLSRRMQLRTVIPWHELSVDLSAHREHISREYGISDNNLEQQIWGLNLRSSWAFSRQDSIILEQELEMRRSDTPQRTIPTDNDLLRRRSAVRLQAYLFDDILCNTRFWILQNEQVFIDAAMSAGNNTTTSFNLVPEIEIAFTDHILLAQSYHIRTDYEDYHWNDLRSDRLFRGINARFSWVYDQQPGFAGFSTHTWKNRPIPPLHDPWTAVLWYEFSRNGSGIRDGDTYNITAEKENNQIGGRLEKIHRNLRFSTAGTIDFASLREYGSTDTFDWYRLYTLAVTIDYAWQERITAGITIQPESTDLPEFKWTVDARLEARF